MIENPPVGFATETTLGLIKTTDGVKKITDALPAGTNLLGKVGIDQTTDGTTNKVTTAPLAATGLTIKAAYTASQTGATVLTPTSGKKVCITAITISASAAGSIYLFDNTDSSTTCIGPTLTLAINSGWDHCFAAKPWVSAAANNVIKYTSGAGAAGSIWIHYFEA